MSFPNEPDPGVRERRVPQGREPDSDTMNAHIDIPSDRIAAFCRRWQVTHLALFGSVLRDDFGPNSDVDVLIDFGEGARHSLFDLTDMELELREIFGREVDLVSRRGVEASRNYLRRNSILQSAQVIYGS